MTYIRREDVVVPEEFAMAGKGAATKGKPLGNPKPQQMPGKGPKGGGSVPVGPGRKGK